ncbi:MAG TPA: signal peptidase I [Spirochaetia bacterium]|nr:signal peptidase I [Spirochaetia bacterium]
MPMMSRRRSFAETVEGRRRLLSRLKAFVLILLAFEILTGLFAAAFALSSSAMTPTFLPGDRVLATPAAFGPRTAFGKLPGPAKPERGDLVLVDPPFAEKPSFWTSLADSFLRFATFQRVSLLGRGAAAAETGPFLERVVALPGDAIRMDSFVFQVRAAGGEHFLTEFELSKSRYDIEKPELPSGWLPDYPLSGTMAERTLGKDEYFLACDNRGAEADSRLWGPLGRDRFRAKVFLRYWPLARFGTP